jgi:putative peptidoglycan lipid II flippase
VTITTPEDVTTESRAAESRRIARSTLTVMIAFGIAKVISLAQTVIIANVFGISAEWDAFVTANRLPEQIFNLIAGGVLSFAFIPVFTGLLADHKREQAWRLASHVINTVFLVTFSLSLLTFIFAPWLVANVVAPGFDAATQAQTADLMRILLVSTLIFSVSGIMMGILQSHNLFLLPALAPILFDIGILIGVIFLIEPFGVYGIAIGAVLGAALHLSIQVPGLLRVRPRWTIELGWNDPALRHIIRLMIPRMIDLGLFSLMTIVTSNIASRLGTGAISALDWGWRIMQIPQTLIGTAMGTVIFPTLAALSAVGNLDGKRDAFSGALRFILIATIPSAIGLIVVGRPLISLLERGAFDSSDSALVYSTLQFFALGIVVHSILEVVARSFYADKDTITPLWAAAGGALINFVVAYFLSGVTQIDSTNADAVVGNVGALALGNTLGVTFEVIFLMWILRRRWQGLTETELGRTTLKTLAASLAMALAVIFIETIWSAAGLDGRGTAMTIAQISAQVLVGGAVFVGVALLLKMDELKVLLSLILRRQQSELPAAM